MYIANNNMSKCELKKKILAMSTRNTKLQYNNQHIIQHTANY